MSMAGGMFVGVRSSTNKREVTANVSGRCRARRTIRMDASPGSLRTGAVRRNPYWRRSATRGLRSDTREPPQQQTALRFRDGLPVRIGEEGLRFEFAELLEHRFDDLLFHA